MKIYTFPHLMWRIPFGDIELPVAFWAVFLLYSLIVLKISKPPFRNPASLLAATGIGINLTDLLIRIELYRRVSGYAFEAGIYALYYYAVYYAALGLISFLAAYLIRKSFVEKNAAAYEIYVAAPFLAVMITALAALAKVTLLIPAASVFFVIIFTGMSETVELVKRAGRFFRAAAAWALNHERLALGLFFIAAISIRMLYLVRTMQDPNYILTGADGDTFDANAWKFATGQSILQSYTAGYWIFLGYIYKIFGHNYFAACSIQIILGGLACIFIYNIIKQITDNIAGAYLGLFLAAVNYGLIFSSVSLGHQALDSFFLPLIALLVIYFVREEAPLRKSVILILAALVSGYALATREGNLLIIAMIPVLMLVHYKKDIIKGIAVALTFSFICVAALVPFAIRNIRNLGVPYPVVYFEKTGVDTLDLLPTEYLYASRGAGNERMVALGINPITDPRGSIDIILKNSKTVLPVIADVMWQKFQGLFLDQEYGRFDMIFLVRGSPFYNTAWLYALFITVFGMIYMLKYSVAGYRRFGAYTVLIFIFLKTLPQAVFNSRFGLRAPIDTLLLVAFSIGITRLFQKSTPQ